MYAVVVACAACMLQSIAGASKQRPTLPRNLKKGQEQDCITVFGWNLDAEQYDSGSTKP